MSERLFEIWRPRDEITPAGWLLLALVIALGAFLRFWGLGNIGLHGDEEVMSMSARSILETGSPVLPSGMHYYRSVLQLHMMAASIFVFGESEWALRLPSALIGTIGVFAGYLLARRFLTVYWSIAFALVIAMLPALIALSQTARMYVFYVTFVMFFAAAVFRWEKTESIGAYLLSIVTCLVSISFHSLTVFSTLLFFYPGIAKLSVRLLAYGGVAFAICLAGFRAISEWTSSQYFDLVTAAPEDDGLSSRALGEPGLLPIVLVFAAMAAIAAVFFVLARRRQSADDRAGWLGLAAGCVAGAVLFTLIVQYHLAGLALIFGAVLAMRAQVSWRLLATAGAVLLVLMAARFLFLWDVTAPDDAGRFIVTTLGKPSPWPYVIFAGIAPLSVVAYGIVALWFVVRFARGNPIPDHFLFMLIAVFAPIFLVGFFAEHLPERYVIGFFPFFVLALFAGTLDLVARLSAPLRERTGMQAIAAVILLALIVHPSELRHNVNPQYSDFPHLTVARGSDQKGAAEFVRAQGSDDDTVVIAMDAQQQQYYLGERLDYYLRSLNADRNSSFVRDGKMLNLYTGTPQIATGDELAQVLEEHRDQQVFIIGSGEMMSNLPRYMGDGIWETMGDYDLEVAYEGRDGATLVWRYGTGSAASTTR